MIASSNTSTLINFYRTNYYSLLKSLFEKILIPSLCWREMISGVEEVDRKFTDRIRLLEDKDTFLSIIDIDIEEDLVQELMDVAEKLFKKRVLDEPEALTIVIAVKKSCRYVLTDDVVAIRVLEALRKSYPERKFPEILNTKDILKLVIQRLVLYFPAQEELRGFIEDFEKGAGISLSRKSREELMEMWKKTQLGKKWNDEQ